MDPFPIAAAGHRFGHGFQHAVHRSNIGRVFHDSRIEAVGQHAAGRRLAVQNRQLLNRRLSRRQLRLAAVRH